MVARAQASDAMTDQADSSTLRLPSSPVYTPSLTGRQAPLFQPSCGGDRTDTGWVSFFVKLAGGVIERLVTFRDSDRSCLFDYTHWFDPGDLPPARPGQKFRAGERIGRPLAHQA